MPRRMTLDEALHGSHHENAPVSVTGHNLDPADSPLDDHIDERPEPPEDKIEECRICFALVMSSKMSRHRRHHFANDASRS